MSSVKDSLQMAFEVFQDRAAYFEKVGEDAYPTAIIRGQLLIIIGAAMIYGAVMGSYNGGLQAISSALKLPALVLFTLFICFPSFYIVQLLLGSTMKLRQLSVILFGGFVMLTILLLAFAPISLFFQLSGSPYAFLQLLHFIIFTFAGFWSMRTVSEALTTACEKRGIYPKIGITVFRIWIFILAFVGIQLSWNLRPFIGSQDMAFEWFRSGTQGNIYATLFAALGRLMGL